VVTSSRRQDQNASFILQSQCLCPSFANKR
jgi:hypothetical protein